MEDLSALPVELDRDIFLRNLLRELSGTLEEVVGLEVAEGYISIVGRSIGAMLDAQYRAALGTERMNLDQVAAVLVDLKRRIQGGFRIASVDGTRIVLTNTACPFGDKVLGRPSLCMMTANVFGTIAAENLGFARVTVAEAIASGSKGCRVIVDLVPDAGTMDQGGIAPREFFQTGP